MMNLSVFVLTALVSASALDRVRDHFKGKTSFEVRFEQEVRQEIFPDQVSKAKGRVVFKKPDHLRWIYESPEKKEIVFEAGKGFIIRDGEKEEIPNARSLGVEESFGFLWGEMSLQKFKVKELSASSVEISPKSQERAQFDRMILEIENSKIQNVRVSDKLGGESLIKFSNWNWTRSSK